jgi:hypothetical protein
MEGLAVRSVDEHGYGYVVTAHWWKNAFASVPSCSTVWWPDYSTKVVDIIIDGQPAVIQLWLGWCQKFPGRNGFPGGIGGEVGVYRRIPGKRPEPPHQAVPQEISDLFLGLAEGQDDLWWAYPELNTTLEFELINPHTGRTFFKAGPEKTYWLSRWMTPDGYERFKNDHQGDFPLFSVNYLMQYKINGKSYEWI